MAKNKKYIRTPKIQAFAVIIDCDEIFLLRVGKDDFTLPGGWVPHNMSIRNYLIKAVWDQTGMDVDPIRCVCIHNRNDHHVPAYDFEACQVFMLCEIERGCYGPDKTPTMEMDFFKITRIPKLIEEDVTFSQIEICFAAEHDPNFVTIVD